MVRLHEQGIDSHSGARKMRNIQIWVGAHFLIRSASWYPHEQFREGSREAVLPGRWKWFRLRPLRVWSFIARAGTLPVDDALKWQACKSCRLSFAMCCKVKMFELLQPDIDKRSTMRHLPLCQSPYTTLCAIATVQVYSHIYNLTATSVDTGLMRHK